MRDTRLALAAWVAGCSWIVTAGAQSTSATPTTSASPSVVTEGEITIHTVTVGKVVNQFDPNSIQANPGDIVSFQFYPSNHSVIEASWGFPCVPIQDVEPSQPGFFSGFFPITTGNDTYPVWNLTINDTSPVWYYCGAPGSCISYGMVGVINPNASTSIDTQITLANKADYMLEPGESLPAGISASIASLAATATQTLTVTATPTTSPTSSATSSSSSSSTSNSSHSSGLSGGAIAGIAIGAAAVAGIAAALFFLIGRNRTLKEQVDKQRGMPDGVQIGLRPYSELPPYHQEYKQPETIGVSDGTGPLTPESPYGQFRQNHVSQYSSQGRQSGFTELVGDIPPFEMGTPHLDADPDAEPDAESVPPRTPRSPRT